MSFPLKRAEATVAGLLTIEAIWLRCVAGTAGGALWRDESNTVALATLPSLSDVWKHLQYDSFPFLWLLIVRGFAELVGPMNDQAFRILGFVVGLGIVGVLWLYSRTVSHSYPLLSLSLFAITPNVVIWGDSLRGYGLGIVLILLTGALLWRFVQRPGLLTFASAAIAAVASVHVLFYNSVLLLAFCAGAAAVCLQTQSRKKAGLVVLIGAAAAVSMLPYLSAIRAARSWNSIVQMPSYTFHWFLMQLKHTLSPTGGRISYLWLVLFCLGICVAVGLLMFRSRPGRLERREATLYSSVSLVVGSFGIFLFLKELSYPTQPWYYLALLGLVVVCLDTIFEEVHTEFSRISRLVIVVLVGASTFIPATIISRTRLTNIDLVAAKLDTATFSADIVLVNPWQTGVSFNRYYHGAAPWMTLPPINFHRFHRYDLIKREMMADQVLVMRPVIDALTKALQEGHRVFIVGGLESTPAGERPLVLSLVPPTKEPYPEAMYIFEWTTMVGDFLHRHADSVANIPIHARTRVSDFEYMSLHVAEGWH